MTESGFVGLDELVTNAEPLESADYVDYELIPVGLYVSQQRTIKAKEKTDGTVTFEISFSNASRKNAIASPKGLKRQARLRRQ